MKFPAVCQETRGHDQGCPESFDSLRRIMAGLFNPGFTAAEAAAWLTAAGFPDAAAAVAAHELDGSDLAHCTAGDFAELSISDDAATAILVRLFGGHPTAPFPLSRGPRRRMHAGDSRQGGKPLRFVRMHWASRKLG